MKAVILLVALAACGGTDGVAPDAAPAVDAPTDSPSTGLSVTPSSHGFGAVEIGASSPALELVVSTGSTTGALTVTTGGQNASDLVRISDTCSGASLTPQATCTVYVALQPSAVGAKSAQVQFTASPGGTVTATITATAVIPAQRQSITPATFAFATVPSGGFSAVPKRFTVTNTGSANVGPMTATITGVDASSFEVDSNHDTCTNHVNGPGESCTVEVYFTPPTVGAKSARLAISPLSSSTVAMLSGTGVEPPRFVATPTAHDYGSIYVGASSASIEFTVRNDGLGASGVMRTTIANPDEFILAPGNTCDGVTLAPGQSCSVHVRFAPLTDGSRPGGLLIGDEIFSAVISQSGTGVILGDPMLTPDSRQFGSVNVGSTSGPQVFTLTNNANFTTAPFDVSLTGAAPGQFRIVPGTDGCTGVALAPAGSCTFAVLFAPTSAGTTSASIRAVAGPGGLIYASLQGTGVGP